MAGLEGGGGGGWGWRWVGGGGDAEGGGEREEDEGEGEGEEGSGVLHGWLCRQVFSVVLFWLLKFEIEGSFEVFDL